MKFRAPSGRGNIRGRERNWCTVRLTGLFVITAILASCQSIPVQTSVFRRDFKPDNIFVYPPRLALEFRRVAVLPIAAASMDGDLPAGCEALAPVLIEQLVKTKKFEAVPVDGENFLMPRTGRTAWTGRETLPPNFFDDLRREYDCDGVLFAELTTYRAYAPLAVGWRFKLVDARTRQIIWAADELFDASQSDVRRAAVKYNDKAPISPIVADKDWAMLNSPRRFGRYTAAALLETLPER
jgi:hypothetical protein